MVLGRELIIGYVDPEVESSSKVQGGLWSSAKQQTQKLGVCDGQVQQLKEGRRSARPSSRSISSGTGNSNRHRRRSSRGSSSNSNNHY